MDLHSDGSDLETKMSDSRRHAALTRTSPGAMRNRQPKAARAGIASSIGLKLSKRRSDPAQTRWGVNLRQVGTRFMGLPSTVLDRL